MIISASRRTDIPAFFGEWFLNRLKEKYFLVRNPFNFKQVSKINVTPNNLDCIVFWTKNPSNFINKLNIIDGYGYPYYFLFTLNAYGKIFEKNIGDIRNVIRVFKTLSTKIGIQKVIWRYDPIIITSEFPIGFHLKHFSFLCSELNGYTQKCITSFITMYNKCKSNLSQFKIFDISENEKINLLNNFRQITKTNNIQLETCAVDLKLPNIVKSKCIDNTLIEKITNKTIPPKKDKNQRDLCNCTESIDIGVYNTCQHQCIYCYANYNFIKVNQTIKLHDPLSPMLIGNIKKNDKIYLRNY